MKLATFSLSMLTALFLTVVSADNVQAANKEEILSSQSRLPILLGNREELSSIKVPSYRFEELTAPEKVVETPVISENAETSETPAPQATPVVEYAVKSGDNLITIAAAFDLSLEELLANNPEITNPGLIHVGQSLKLTTTTTLEAAEEKLSPAAETNASGASEVAKESNPETTEATTNYSGTTLVMESTAYSYQQAGLTNFTALGIDLTQNPMVIAVDPSVIPLGSRVYVEGYGEAIAGDTGGAIQGNIIDVHFASVDACYQWGRRSVNVTILS